MGGIASWPKEERPRERLRRVGPGGLGDAELLTVVIEGHCDERGTIEYNLALGEKRAAAVKEYLVRYGISENRLRTVSFGEERPIDSAQTEEAWARNRRAHLRAR